MSILSQIGQFNQLNGRTVDEILFERKKCIHIEY